LAPISRLLTQAVPRGLGVSPMGRNMESPLSWNRSFLLLPRGYYNTGTPLRHPCNFRCLPLFSQHLQPDSPPPDWRLYLMPVPVEVSPLGEELRQRFDGHGEELSSGQDRLPGTQLRRSHPRTGEP